MTWENPLSWEGPLGERSFYSLYLPVLLPTYFEACVPILALEEELWPQALSPDGVWGPALNSRGRERGHSEISGVTYNLGKELASCCLAGGSLCRVTQLQKEVENSLQSQANEA